MFQPPDFAIWAFLETLSPHALACLVLGVHPDADPDPKFVLGSAPVVPDEYWDEIDPEEWYAAYRCVFVPLSTGVKSGAIPLRSNGEPSVSDALAYLKRNANASRWSDFVAESRFVKAYLSRLAQQAEADLIPPVASPLSTVPTPSAPTEAVGHVTDDLLWLQRARSEFAGDEVTTVFVTRWIFDTAAREMVSMTKTRATRIARMLTPAARKLGGRPKRKN